MDPDYNGKVLLKKKKNKKTAENCCFEGKGKNLKDD